MTRVLVASAEGAHSPAMRVRAVIPSARLRGLGVNVVAAPLFEAAEYAAFQRAGLPMRFQMVLAARRRAFAVSRRDPAGAAWIVRRADMLPTSHLENHLVSGRRFVYDVDDAIWFDGREAGGHPLAFLKGSRRKAQFLASIADHVIAGNEILAEWLCAFSDRVTVVPSLVDTDAVPIRTHAPSERVELGWIGSTTTAPYLRGAVPALEAAALQAPDIEFVLRVVGGVAPSVRGIRSIQQPWSEENERDALRTIDIGLMPLPDTRWTRGKSAYKAVQYMAAGIPVVADDVGVTAKVVGRGGVIATGLDDWTQAIICLAQDSLARSSMGTAGREHAVRDLSVRAWAPQIAKVLEGN